MTGLDNLQDIYMQCECCKSIKMRPKIYKIDQGDPSTDNLKIMRYIQEKWPEYHTDIENGDLFGAYLDGDYIGFGISTNNKRKDRQNERFISHLVIAHHFLNQDLEIDLIKKIIESEPIHDARLYIVAPDKEQALHIQQSILDSQIVSTGSSQEITYLGLSTLNDCDSDNCYIVSLPII